MLYEGRPAGHPELWIGGTSMPESRGPEKDLEMWEEAEAFLDYLCGLHEGHSNSGVIVALVNAYNLCIEERRRATDLLELHEVWMNRGVGGVHEPPSAVRETPVQS